MKITIEIPKEFESHYIKDAFKDSLERLKADANCLAGNYEIELCDMLIKAFEETHNYTTPHLLTHYVEPTEWRGGADGMWDEAYDNLK